MRQGAPISLWDSTAVEQDYLAEMDGDQVADVAIVGGGFTGLSTALHAAALGQDCLVLEANHIGYGGSGRNAGLLNAGVWLAPQDVRAQLGDEAGSKLVALLSDGPGYVFSLIEKHQIRCEAKRNGTIHAAHSPTGLKDLVRRHDEWRRLRQPVELLSREDTAAKIGTNRFVGGLLDHRAGTINPMGYVRGLARAARGAGARIATGVRVQSLNRSGDRWKLQTPRGTVTAKQVVIATETYSDQLWPGLSDSLIKIHYFQLATEPLGERGAHILPERQGVWDTAPIMISFRRDAFDRLIIGSMGTVRGGMTGMSKRWAESRVQRYFPELGELRFDAAWHGQIGMTPDHLPRIHRLAEGLYTPIGYNGRGISPGTMFGKVMAELVSGGREDALPIPVTDLRPAPNRALKSRLYELTFAANQFVKSL